MKKQRKTSYVYTQTEVVSHFFYVPEHTEIKSQSLTK